LKTVWLFGNWMKVERATCDHDWPFERRQVEKRRRRGESKQGESSDVRV
jgi:hypothetical protein